MSASSLGTVENSFWVKNKRCMHSIHVLFIKILGFKNVTSWLDIIFFLFQFAGETFHIEYLTDLVKEWHEKERGSFPTPIECTIIVWVFSCIWRDLKEVYERHSDLESIIPVGKSAIPSIKIKKTKTSFKSKIR